MMNIISIKEISLLLILLFSTVSVKGQVNIQDSIFYDSTHSRIFELEREIKNEDTLFKNTNKDEILKLNNDSLILHLIVN